MRLSKNTVLVTGGSNGIGFALAKRFVDAGSEVIICGRSREKLAHAKKLCPALHTLRADVSSESERTGLARDVLREFPHLNVLVNNAGIQNRPPALAAVDQPQDWKQHREEIATNLEAPMHLSMLLIPHLLKQKDPAILNVSSGLAFAPLAMMPTYCATKAAIHSFTLSLRQQLVKTPIQVVEIIPPAVNTDLGGKGLHDFGVPLDEFADHAMAQIGQGQLEFGYGTAETRRKASREELDEYFSTMNGR